MKILSLIIISVFLSSAFTWASDPHIPDEPVKLSVSQFEHNDGKYLALNFENAQHWHTYWKNPGDAGLPIKVQFLFNGTQADVDELDWPAPKRYVENGDILAYGYSGSYSLFFKIDDTFIEQWSNNPLTLKSNWLVCRHICIPGEVELTFPMRSDVPNADQLIIQRFESLPKTVDAPTYLELTLAKDGEGLALYYNLSKPVADQIQSYTNLLTPYPLRLFDFRRETLYKDSKRNIYGKFPIDWDGEYQEPEVPLPDDGIFEKPYTMKFLYANPVSGEIEVIEKTFSNFDTNKSKSLNQFLSLLTKVPFSAKRTKPIDESGDSHLESDTSSATNPQKSSNIGFLLSLLFAFLGGLILNLMPCVLPVISLKLFGLIKHRNASKKEILTHNLAYTLGVLVTFLILGIVIILVKTTGESIGWGFQLQSPSFVATMIVILFIFSLNMFGLFEVATPGGKHLGGVHLESGFMGDFFSGVLATILSTPCSAPFLGTALTIAFTSPAIETLTLFLFIGLGLSFPFILSGFFPVLVKFLPSPGLWMDHLKKFLGLTLLLTCIWLFDVYAALIDGAVSWPMLLTLSLIFFTIYFYKKISTNIIAMLILVALLTLSAAKMYNTKSLNTSSNGMTQAFSIEQGWIPWSPQKLAELKEQQATVFMDFTAKWCFTCKVNERLVIKTDRFSQLAKKYNLKLLLGDWTKRDPVIGDWLKQQGLVGVPAYFIQRPDGSLINLGETITIEEIEGHLKN